MQHAVKRPPVLVVRYPTPVVALPSRVVECLKRYSGGAATVAGPEQQHVDKGERCKEEPSRKESGIIVGSE